MSDLLQQGIAAARAGKREESRALLMRVVDDDAGNEQAWLWLSGVVDDPEDIRTCLHNVLALNPDNQQAKQGLVWVDKRYGPPAPVESFAPEGLSESVHSSRMADASVDSAVLEVPPPIEPVAQQQSRLAALAQQGTNLTSASEQVPDYPCPYCGVATRLTHKECPHCHKDLMVRDAPQENNSIALTVLGWLWAVSGALTILAGLLSSLGLMISYQRLQALQARVTPNAPAAFPTNVLLSLVVSVLLGIWYIWVARALWRRARWAYYMVVGLSILGVIGVVFSFARLGSLSNQISSSLPTQSPGSQESAQLTAGAATATLGCIAILYMLYFVLIALSFRNFFGPWRRFSPEMAGGDHVQHYNNGISYKNRKMWYMATQEWLTAHQMQPHNTNYLLGLGLAYAQLKQIAPADSVSLRKTHDYLLERQTELYALAPDLEQAHLL